MQESSLLSTLSSLLGDNDLWLSLQGAEVWLAILLLLGVVLLARRHSLLYYGTKYTRWVVALPLGVLLLSSLRGRADLMSDLIVLLLILTVIEKLLNSLGKEGRYFSVFDIGFLLSIASLYHVGYWLLYPYVLLRLRQISLLSRRHRSAFFMGVLTPLWLWGLLTSGREWSVEWARFEVYLRGFYTLHPPSTLAGGLYIGACLVVMISITLFARDFYTSALERHRYFLSTHIGLSWIFLLLYALYCESPHSGSFLLLSFFFSSTILQLFYSTVKDRIWLAFMTIPILIVGGIGLYLQLS